MPDPFGVSTLLNYICSIYACYSTEPTVPTVTITSPDATAGELGTGLGNGMYRISRNVSTPSSLRVYYITTGTADSGSDYEPLPGYVDIPDNQTTADIPVTVINDSTPESTETVIVTLTSNAAYTIGNPSSASITIEDDDYGCKSVGNTAVFSNISVSGNRRAVQYTMPEAGQLQCISIYHQGGTGQMILAVYADSAGKPGALLGRTNSTTINSTEGWQKVDLQSPVPVSSGQKIWLAWVFENNPGIRYTTGTAPRAISNDTWSGGMPDPFGVSTLLNYICSIYACYSTEPTVPTVPTVTITSPDATAGELGTGLGNGMYRICRTGSTASPLTVNFNAPTGDATRGSDYRLKKGATEITTNSVTIDLEQSYVDVTLDVIDDSLVESMETATLTLALGTGYAVDTPGFASVTIQDDDCKPVGNTTVFSQISVSGNRRAVQYTMPEAGQLHIIKIYHQGGTGKVILAVYADSAGKPGTRLGVTDPTEIERTEGWQKVKLQSPVPVSSGQKIWLAWVFENNPGIRYMSGTTPRAISNDTWSGGMPDPFGVSTLLNYICSIYACYST
jgi:hypothetical protein